eukprot:CAMPEP_0114526816 /NCGR_PEP_ID=MMETSP0109-20121206/23250_1 /TAXON_ID=29199 /ORGANISM="Chlorarachnion reptans, Strain CCCM449" /LENGTH=117 /DNA_ID=CAMNT_0001708671 /DNA_START=9 /DNA_END=363 /DNA_ORIENTATION=+
MTNQEDMEVVRMEESQRDEMVNASAPKLLGGVEGDKKVDIGLALEALIALPPFADPKDLTLPTAAAVLSAPSNAMPRSSSLVVSRASCLENASAASGRAHALVSSAPIRMHKLAVAH